MVKGFFMAWGCFCRVPCPWKVWDENLRKEMLVMLPVLGLLMGGVWYAIGAVLMWLNVPAPLLAAVLTLYPSLVTGFIHLDGFMDCSDAICSRASMERKQEILKDSHVGAFAVIWAIAVFLLFYASMWSWLSSGKEFLTMIIIMMASRTVSAANVLKRPSLGSSQYSAMTGGSRYAKIAIAALVFAMILYVIFTGFVMSVIPVCIGIAASVIAIRKGVKELGAMSGDISGYGIVWGELAAVIAAACIL